MILAIDSPHILKAKKAI